MPESVVTMYESKLKMVESRANQIKNIMDLATNTVLRYTETMLQVRILDMTVDYVIDKKSQIWMLWAPETKFTRAKSLEGIDLPNLLDKKGRAGWMGDKYFEEVQDREHFDQTQTLASTTRPGSTGARNHSPGFDRSSRTTGNFSPSRSHAGLNLTYTEPTATSPTSHANYRTHPMPTDTDVLLHIATAQINDANNAPTTVKAQTQRKRASEKSESANVYNVTQQESVDSIGKFPQAFKCKGDYCDFLVTPTGNLAAHESAAEHHAHKLFTKKEIEMLRKDKNFAQMMQYESSGAGLAALTMRSILLARQERRGMSVENTSQPWNTFPDSPRGKIKFRSDPPAIAHLEDRSPSKSHEEQVNIFYNFFFLQS